MDGMVSPTFHRSKYALESLVSSRNEVKHTGMHVGSTRLRLNDFQLTENPPGHLSRNPGCFVGSITCDTPTRFPSDAALTNYLSGCVAALVLMPFFFANDTQLLLPSANRAKTGTVCAKHLQCVCAAQRTHKK